LLEGVGIPHVEISLILVDGVVSDWNTKVKEGLRISVYPSFRSIEGIPQTLNPKYPLSDISFVADVHLGKLVRFLRMVGYDTLYDSAFSDEEIISISSQESRVILTRDKGILCHGSSQWGYFLRSQNPREQLHEVLSTFGFPKNAAPLSRCMVCNGLIAKISKVVANQEVLKEIIDQYEYFFRCEKCGRIYWEGSHYLKMRSDLNKLSLKFAHGCVSI